MKDVRYIKWEEDIVQLASELPERHKNLFFQMKKSIFYNEIEKLKNNIDVYGNLKIVTEIMRIVALAGDAHTSANPPVGSYIPIEFYWFPEGIYITGTSMKYREYINCRVTHINGTLIETVIERIKLIISHENEAFLRALLPRFMPGIELLYGLNIITELDGMELTVENLRGEKSTLWIEGRSYREAMEELREEIDIKIEELRREKPLMDKLPLYRRNSHRNYWWDFLEEQNLLYLNYNSCQEMEDEPIASFCKGILDFINDNTPSSIVVDLRNNLGGNSTLLDPMIIQLAKYKKLNPNLMVYTIIGRDTFSSALLNAYSLKNKLKSIMIGEPTGGKPNCYGEVKYFTLNNSKIRIGYSTEFYRLIRSNQVESLFPDVAIEISMGDYIRGIDPCMEFILGQV